MSGKKRRTQERSDTHGETQPALPGPCVNVGGLIFFFLLLLFAKKKNIHDNDGWYVETVFSEFLPSA